MARGKLKRDDFMKEIADVTRDIVAKAKSHESDTVPGDYGKLNVPCPKCGGEIHGELQKIPVPEMRFCALENCGEPAVGNFRGRGTDQQGHGRAVAGFSQQAGISLCGHHQDGRGVQAGV